MQETCSEWSNEWQGRFKEEKKFQDKVSLFVPDCSLALSLSLPLPSRFKALIKKVPSQTFKMGGFGGSPLASGASRSKQEMFVPVASVCLTRHYTRIWPLGMLQLKGPLANKILMLRQVLYYI